MDETALADAFEEATYHVEHHSHDLNYIGKYVLSSLPRENGYKVVLTGEGADEQFGGYPLFLPDFLGGVEGDKRKEVVKNSYDLIGADTSYFGNASPLPIITPAAMSAFTPPMSLFNVARTSSPVDTIERNIPPHVQQNILSQWHGLHSAQYVWQKGHLANQFLSCLGDRVEMAHSVEARTPFLDHVLTGYVNNLPPELKIRRQAETREGETGYIEKYALREAVKPFVTDEVYERTKHAYTAPTTYPIDGPIHRMLRGLVTKEKVDKLGFVNWLAVEELFGAAFDPAHEDGADNGKDGNDDKIGRKTWAWRQIVMVAQWVVLAERFEIAAARA